MEIQSECLWSIFDLPLELIAKVFSYCDGASLGKASGVCKSFREVIQSPGCDTDLWKRFCILEGKPKKQTYRKFFINGKILEHRLKDPLYKVLDQSIVGQGQAIDWAYKLIISEKRRAASQETVSSASPQVATALAKIKEPAKGPSKNDRGRPRAVAYFTGPPGTGKTKLTQVMASMMGRPLIRFNLVGGRARDKLTGIPPGYIGYGKDNSLASKVLEQPNAVVVFENFECGSRGLVQNFLHILERGYLIDSSSKKVSFSETIIILISGLEGQKISALDWENDPDTAIEISKGIARETIQKKAGYSLASRIDIVPFRPLWQQSIKEIMRAEATRIAKELKREDIFVTIDDKAWLLLVRGLGDIKTNGVRPIIEQFREEMDLLVTGLKEKEGKINTEFSIRITRDKEGELCAEQDKRVALSFISKVQRLSSSLPEPLSYEDHKFARVHPSLQKLYLTNYGIRQSPDETEGAGGEKTAEQEVSFLSVWQQQTLIEPSSIARFEDLKVLVLNRCVLNELPSLGKHLANLHLDRCIEGPITPKVGRPVRTGLWKFEKLNALRAITIKNCVCQLLFAPNDVKTAKLEWLSIENHNIGTARRPLRLSDQNFVCFPQSLTRVSLKGSNITKKSIEKLPKTITQLALSECLFIPEYRELSFTFPGCLIEGVRSFDLRKGSLYRRLQRRVFGQSIAISEVVRSLDWPTNRLSRKKPLILTFAGAREAPMLELGIALAREIGRSFVTYNISEIHQEKGGESCDRLIGRGHGDGLLADTCAHIPDAVILLNSIELAPLGIWQFLSARLVDPYFTPRKKEAPVDRMDTSEGNPIKISIANNVIILIFNINQGSNSQTLWEMIKHKVRSAPVSRSLSEGGWTGLKNCPASPIWFDS